MRIVILSRRRSLYSTRRLNEEAEKRGHVGMIVDPLKCVLSVRTGSPAVLLNGRALAGVSVVIPRVGTVGAGFTLAVIRQFALMGVPSLNDHGAIARARNKLGTLQLLVQSGLPVPETVVARYPHRLERLLRMVGGVPVVLKLTRGTQGIGVMLAETAQTVESILESMWSLGEDIMMQRFVATSRGQDIRAFVCGGRVVAAMRRIAPPGEFRANIHQGARGVAVELPEDYAALAVRAAQVVGLRVAGVDLLQDRNGPCLLEVNPSPGLQGIEAATGRNVAGEVVEEAISLAKE